jgi:uncharacterized protein
MRDGGLSKVVGTRRVPSASDNMQGDEHVASAEPADGTRRVPTTLKARGIRRWVYLSLGMVCLGLAAVGAVVPVLPCTPWVLAASFFFARSSERFTRLLRRTPYFGHIIRDWEAHRGIRTWVKFTAVSCVTIFMTLMGIFLDVSCWS